MGLQAAFKSHSLCAVPFFFSSWNGVLAVYLRTRRTATEMTGDVLSHHIWGPRKKSWGIEMTLITSFMRGAARHTALIDIVRYYSIEFSII